MKLPIDQIESQFLQEFGTLDQGGRLVLTAPTGSGKSTRVPLWCFKSNSQKVIVLEPRRVAARTLAGWVAKGMGENVGKSVGYNVRFDKKHTEDTKILFVTPGVARRFLVEGKIKEFGTVVFDEFHERSWETDALLALLAAEEQGPKLVIMSATLTAEVLASKYEAKTLQSEGRSFPVEVSYDDSQEAELIVPSLRHVASRAAKRARLLWKEKEQGSILVFLPGLAVMREVASKLSPLPTVLLHGSFNQQEQSRAFDPSQRKIVLATNVAESSLTIPGVIAVVDSGLERRQVHQSGFVALATVPIALSSADQRAGRAGRTCPGVCWRLWSKKAKLELSKPPDLCRMELDDLVLFLAALPQGLATKTCWLDPPPEFALERASHRGEKQGLIQSDGRLSTLGRKAQRLPVDHEWARILVSAPKELQSELCSLCALATARRSPVKSTRSEEILASRKADWGIEPWGQALAILKSGDAKKHALDPEGLAMCCRVSDELRRLLGLEKTPCPAANSPRALALALAELWPERFFLLRGSKRQAWGNGKSECQLARGEELPEDCSAAFFLQVNPTLGRGLKVELQARWGLPVRVSLLKEAGLGEPILSKIRWVKNKLQARIVYQHAGRDLSSSEEVLENKALRKALATLAVEKRWMKEAFALVEKEQFYAQLAHELEGKKEPGIPIQEYFESRLEELGVESCEDLELLEESDFLSRNLDPTQLEELSKTYPQTYQMGGAVFQVSYFPLKKQVILNSLNKTKGIKINARHLPRWNGWKIELNERGRKTTLRP